MPVHPQLSHRTCYHKYEIAPGLFTPGQFLDVDPKRCLDELGIPSDLAGVRALDIGAADGPYTFELERRGAEVVALDIQHPDKTIFNAVKEIIGSSAKHVQAGIYDATPELLGTFDLVLYAGVYYHLKNPVLGFQRIRRLMKDGAPLYIEGAAGTEWLANELIRRLGLPESRRVAVTEILDEVPVAVFDTKQQIYPDWSNWFFPTTQCLEDLLIDSGFRDVKLTLEKNAFYQYSHRRIGGQAIANPEKRDPEAQEHEHAIGTADPTSNRLAQAPPPRSPLARLLVSAPVCGAREARDPSGFGIGRSYSRPARHHISTPAAPSSHVLIGALPSIREL